ncbi:hypothetical protein PRN20_15145 [Devosia sp. ZB163]|uniref:hypothetical protein n=1 Tax=Devosia sp. ZB163 TaxID=3025938 RepID=UPI002360A4F1|nr:hypothetical protein [Devosia sp. ZB163]MDC9825066.1 hypothetical protein [Devosia sp. ZB163]
MLGATASLATLCLATPALADPTGFVSLGVGPTSLEFDGGSPDVVDGWAIEALASGAYMFTSVLGAQGDVRFMQRTLSESSDDLTLSNFDGALHGFYREEGFLVGGFVQIGRDNADYNGFSDGETNRSYLGGEAQVFVDNLTLYGQGGMQKYDFGSGGPSLGLSGWFGNLEARYFLTPNFSIEGRVGINTLEFEIFDATLTTVSAGIGAEYKFDDLPLSLFASYDYASTSFDQGPSNEVRDHRFLVGARFALGEDTLLDRDRNGASLEAVKPLGAPLVGFMLVP